MGSDGVEPPESEDSRFTVCPATTYGITALNKSWRRFTDFSLSTLRNVRRSVKELNLFSKQLTRWRLCLFYLDRVLRSPIIT